MKYRVSFRTKGFRILLYKKAVPVRVVISTMIADEGPGAAELRDMRK